MSTIHEAEELKSPLVAEHVKAERWAMPEAAEVALDEARSLKAVETAADCEYAVDLAQKLLGYRKAAVEHYKPIKQMFDRLKGFVLRAEDADTLPLEIEGKRVATLAAKWVEAERERERIARQAAEREAREKAEREQRELAERLKRAAEKAPDEGVKQAILTEAAQTAAAPIAQPKVQVASNIPSMRGFVPSRTTYSARVETPADFELLVQAAAGPLIAKQIREALAAGTEWPERLEAVLTALESSKVPMDALQPNDKRLNQAATDSKEALRWPGVTVLRNNSPVVRS